MRILFLSSWFPYPPDNGSRIRIYNLLRALAQRHSVALITFAEPKFSLVWNASMLALRDVLLGH